MNAPAERERYIDGMRILLSVLELHPEIPLPAYGRLLPVTMTFFSGGDERERMAAAARAFPCAWKKKTTDGDGRSYFDLEGQLAGLSVQLTAFRDTVCRRVVTGTREVTETVKDPAKLAEVPEVEVTRVIEEVAWECGPLLASLPERAPAWVQAGGPGPGTGSDENEGASSGPAPEAVTVAAVPGPVTEREQQ